MICIGFLTLVVGFVLRIVVVERVGAVVLAIGLLLLLLALLGRPLGNRNWF